MASSTQPCSLATGHVLRSCWSYPDPWRVHLRSFCLDLLRQRWRPSLSWHYQLGVNTNSCGQLEHRGCLQGESRCTCQRKDVFRRPEHRINAVVCSFHSSWNIHQNEGSYADTSDCTQQSSTSPINNSTSPLHIVFDFSILSLSSSHSYLVGMHWAIFFPIW